MAQQNSRISFAVDTSQGPLEFTARGELHDDGTFAVRAINLHPEDLDIMTGEGEYHLGLREMRQVYNDIGARLLEIAESHDAHRIDVQYLNSTTERVVHIERDLTADTQAQDEPSQENPGHGGRGR